MQSVLLQRQRSATHRARPADYRADLPGQAEFLAATERRVIWFGGNGLGKTEALARRLVRVLEGTDPICIGVDRPLQIVLTVTGYDAVSCRDFARQLHHVAPAGLLAQVDIDERGRPIGRASDWYGAAKGFRGRPPRVVVQCGPMRGTVLNVTTQGSGSGAAAGGTIDLILVNEPVSRDLLEELATRDRADSLGYLWYALTPIPGAPDQSWIPDLARAWGASCRFVQTRITEDALRFPSGRRLEPWVKTANRIAGWSAISRRQRLGESLEPLLDSTFFADVWHDGIVVSSCPLRGMWLVGGIDHGLQQGRLRVVISGWTIRVEQGIRRLYGCAICEYRGTSADLTEAARGVLAMFDRAGIPIEAVDEWIGDRAIVANRGEVVRDNRAFRAAILLELRRRAPQGTPEGSIVAPPALWSIQTPQKRAGSHWISLGALRSGMAESRITILDVCPILIEDVQRWDGNVRHAHKDGLDAWRYGEELAVLHYGIRTD